MTNIDEQNTTTAVQFLRNRARDHPEITGGLIQVLLWAFISITVLAPVVFLYAVEYALRPVFNAWESVLWALFAVIAAVVSLVGRLGIAVAYTYIAYQICGVAAEMVSGRTMFPGRLRFHAAGAGTAVGSGSTPMEKYLGPERERGLTDQERETRRIWEETMKVWEKDWRARQLDAEGYGDVEELEELSQE